VLADDFAAHLEPGVDGRLRFRFSRAAVIAAYGEMAKTPPLGLLTRPVCVVRATGSRVCPPELVGALAEAAGPLLTSVDLDAGHTVMWDAPEETAALVERSLAAAGR
jgi:lipase